MNKDIFVIKVGNMFVREFGFMDAVPYRLELVQDIEDALPFGYDDLDRPLAENIARHTGGKFIFLKHVQEALKDKQRREALDAGKTDSAK
ncbi:hypothetical protein IV38_GL000099 [Lactobacillus selangorensis]|uniref:Uncharacterized protein n=1 Tax=Lactobacillus selangorensis TaxID=81857 RepID=A0A0R2FSG5_9LACO|nr:hypothetical protein [Lactobacillus selangorensis]KRN29219.1 hypothetical protein IV38_GL000099 [Lactobacillus selangorensis]KRN31423.1 hypothetical protein IV40_GL001419 [Lactobacillus selangorensis]